MNFDLSREVMVKDQLIKRGISDKRVIAAFNKVPRHKFVPADEIEDAYSDFPLPLECNQSISQPYIVALMTEKLALTGRERVLEIGTGSGYQTAILAELAKEVYTIEKIPVFSEKAQRLLEERGYSNIYFKIGDGSLGWEEKSPFDRIIITAYCPEIPEPLVVQLSENGKIILPLGGVFSQILTLAEKKNNKLDRRDICPCVFVPLIGEYGAKTK